MRSVIVSLALVLCACGGPSKKLQAASTARYDLDPHTGFKICLDVVRARTHKIQANEAIGTIRTAWDLVMTLPAPTNDVGSRSMQRTRNDRYFVRFDIMLVGPRPWEVRVVGHASKWAADLALPSELQGGDEPAWLQERTSAMRLAIYDRLRAYDVRESH
jgi:hypothetical protein